MLAGVFLSPIPIPTAAAYYDDPDGMERGLFLFPLRIVLLAAFPMPETASCTSQWT